MQSPQGDCRGTMKGGGSQAGGSRVQLYSIWLHHPQLHRQGLARGKRNICFLNPLQVTDELTSSRSYLLRMSVRRGAPTTATSTREREGEGGFASKGGLGARVANWPHVALAGWQGLAAAHPGLTAGAPSQDAVEEGVRSTALAL